VALEQLESPPFLRKIQTAGGRGPLQLNGLLAVKSTVVSHLSAELETRLMFFERPRLTVVMSQHRSFVFPAFAPTAGWKSWWTRRCFGGRLWNSSRSGSRPGLAAVQQRRSTLRSVPSPGPDPDPQPAPPKQSPPDFRSVPFPSFASRSDVPTSAPSKRNSRIATPSLRASVTGP